MIGLDKVFCVFDRDCHTSYKSALDKIKNHKPNRHAKSKPIYQAIISSPCFEIWLLLTPHQNTKKCFGAARKAQKVDLVNLCK